MKPFSHKALREVGKATGKHFTLSTTDPNHEARHVICSSDAMLQRLLPVLSYPTMQWIDASSESIELKHPHLGETFLIVSYQGEVSDFVQRLGMPLYVADSSVRDDARSNPPHEVLPLPPEFEEALKQLTERKRKVVQLFEDGSFKIA
jgi:hypothetical protein